GYEHGDVGRGGLARLIHPDDVEHALGAFATALAEPGASASVECRIRHRSGEWRHVEAVGTNLLHDPAVGGFLLNARDITDRKEAEARLAHQALHDSLTELPNRALFLDRLGVALSRAGRHSSLVAVFFVDLDQFKVVNDSLGHPAGDEVLEVVAERLAATLREGDSAARLGGDEFAVLCEDIADEREAVAIAERILAAIALEPVTLGRRQVTVTASLGIAVAGTTASQPEDLLRDADAALYRAKERGRGRAEVFGETMR